MTHSPFKYLCYQPPNPIWACPYPCQPLVIYIHSAPIWSWTWNTQRLLCLFRTANIISGAEMFSVFVCTCDGGGLQLRGGGGERACACTYIGVRACVCVCVYMPLCVSLNMVQLQGTCCSAGCCDVILPPLHSVFTPAWVTPLQLPLWGGVHVCVQGQTGGILKLNSVWASTS